MSTRKEQESEPRAIRQLGHNEAYQLAMYMLDQYRGTSVYCRYKIPSAFSSIKNYEKLKNTVNGAILRTVMKHPTLQVGILGAGTKNPVWVQLDKLDIQHHIEWRSVDRGRHQEIQSIIESQLDTKFQDLEKRPGWRVISVLNELHPDILDVIFTWNHPNADGMSGKLFHTDLLKILNMGHSLGPQYTSSGDVFDLPSSPLEFVPTTEKLTSLPVSVNFLLKALWEESKMAVIRRSALQAHWAPIRASPYKTRLRAFTIGSNACSNIRAACREHKTTITGLLHGLTFLSLCWRTTDGNAIAFEGATTIDLRRFLPLGHSKYPEFVPEHTIGNFVSLMSHKFLTPLTMKIRSQIESIRHFNGDLSPELWDSMWTISSRVRSEIKKRLKLGLKNDPVGLMRHIPDWQKYLTNLAQKPRQYSWMVTNLGVLNGDPDLEANPKPLSEAWAITEAQFSLSAETTSAAIMISPISVVGDRLCVAGSWQECIMRDGLAEHIMGDLEMWLGRIGSKSDRQAA
ncbi:hypothetical protein O1611_g1151 [Lasiodiplodia mahajangana]|uniref:Uncharacterized protein n=1 Tax=Lasiodiplodia mahajangana TaxID=1108764 RepID=A0ACC2JYJ2_9PEZI|nr:hypothetical protein O1611_g1151 [Lasiodiplodia mahajangana]